MAGIKLGTAIDDVTLTGAAATTILQIVAATNHRVMLKGFSVWGKGIAGDAEPVVWELVVQSTAGTSSAGTVVKKNADDSETVQTTSITTCTVEPTSTTVLRKGSFHPQTGYAEVLAFGDEIPIKGGTRLGLRVTAPVAVDVGGEFNFEE